MARRARGRLPRTHAVAQVLFSAVVLTVLWRSARVHVLPGQASPRTTSLARVHWASALDVVFIAWAMVRQLDRRPFVSLGFSARGWLPDLLFGLALGLVSLAVVFVVLVAGGWAAFEAQPSPGVASALAWSLIAFVGVGLSEELSMRGYVLQNVTMQWGAPAGVIVSSLLFAALHLLNPGVAPLAVVNLVLVGILFSYGYFVTRNLWLPIGYHIAWNFAEGPIFGFQVSGIHAQALLQTTPRGPDVITGGAFGPEGGLAVTAAILWASA